MNLVLAFQAVVQPTLQPVVTKFLFAELDTPTVFRAVLKELSHCV